jgi:hypothetical protein
LVQEESLEAGAGSFELADGEAVTGSDFDVVSVELLPPAIEPITRRASSPPPMYRFFLYHGRSALA